MYYISKYSYFILLRGLNFLSVLPRKKNKQIKKKTKKQKKQNPPLTKNGSKIKWLLGMEIALKSLNRCQYASTHHWVMHTGANEDKDGIEVT